MRLILKLGMKEKDFVFSLYRFTQKLRLTDFHWPEMIYCGFSERLLFFFFLPNLHTPDSKSRESPGTKELNNCFKSQIKFMYFSRKSTFETNH